jgi:hypothetical protein
VNILIVGGLLVLAVVAIGVAVLLGLSEDRSEKVRQTDSPSFASQSTQTWPTTPLPTLDSVPPTPVQVRQTGRLATFDEGDALPGTNGQVREITGELRALTQRAGELERRLSDLSDLFERQRLRPSDESYTSSLPSAEVSSL